GQSESGLARLIRAAFGLLGLQTYFTAGPKEVRAWTIHVGDTAPQAAGVIHTDFERGFIRAQTIPFADYVACKGEQRAKEAGQLALLIAIAPGYASPLSPAAGIGLASVLVYGRGMLGAVALGAFLVHAAPLAGRAPHETMALAFSTGVALATALQTGVVAEL